MAGCSASRGKTLGSSSPSMGARGSPGVCFLTSKPKFFSPATLDLITPQAGLCSVSCLVYNCEDLL